MRPQRYGMGSAVAATILASRSTSSWTYQGCYLDSVSNRTFSHFTNIDGNTQTVETCTSYCATNGYSLAGLEYGRECYCDYFLPAGATKQPETECAMACTGNSAEICGNGDRLSVYSHSNDGPSTNPGVNGWTYLACYTDSTGSRTLRGSQSVAGGSSNMSVAGCTTACQSAGFSLAGLEFGQECWCDSAINSPGTVVQNGCDMLCSGNLSEYCGSQVRLNIYQLNSTSTPSTGVVHTGWTALGCYTDDVSNRTLPSYVEVAGGYTNMTTEGCLNTCADAGYPYGGLEYAQECYCSSSVNNGACAADQTNCYQPCRGNSNEICGGPNRLNLYYSGPSAGASICSIAATASLATTLSTITSSTASSVQTTTTSPGDATSLTSTSTLLSTSTSSLQVSSTSTTVSPTTTSSTTASTTSSTSTALSSAAASSTTPSTTIIPSTKSSSSPTSTVCPSFWSAVVSDLAPSFRDSGGQCNSLARAAIRYAFHDAAAYSSKLPFYAPAAGGADGSLLLSPTEINRADNDGLRDYHSFLAQKLDAYNASGYSISAADLIQVAGSLGVVACPGGRIGRVYVGRADSTTAAPDGLLPNAFGQGSDHDTIYNLFVDKGFTARDLAALMGAHSTALANFQTGNGIPSGTPLDSTPGLWDVNYYNETFFPPSGIARLDSDINLSDNVTSAVGKQFKSFVGAQGAWGVSFQSAWQAMTLLGVPSSVRRTMQDCTVVVGNAYS